MQIIVHDCYTLLEYKNVVHRIAFRYIFRICFHVYIESIQRLIMQIMSFSMILSTMEFITLRFSRLSDIALYTLKALSNLKRKMC